jgi:hypothetical protein
MLTDVWQVIKWRGRFGMAVKYLGGVQGFRSLFLRDGKLWWQSEYSDASQRDKNPGLFGKHRFIPLAEFGSRLTRESFRLAVGGPLDPTSRPQCPETRTLSFATQSGVLDNTR